METATTSDDLAPDLALEILDTAAALAQMGARIEHLFAELAAIRTVTDKVDEVLEQLRPLSEQMAAGGSPLAMLSALMRR